MSSANGSRKVLIRRENVPQTPRTNSDDKELKNYVKVKIYDFFCKKIDIFGDNSGCGWNF